MAGLIIGICVLCEIRRPIQTTGMRAGICNACTVRQACAARHVVPQGSDEVPALLTVMHADAQRMKLEDGELVVVRGKSASGPFELVCLVTVVGSGGGK